MGAVERVCQREGRPGNISSFGTLDEAESLVTEALRANVDAIQKMLRTPKQASLKLVHAVEGSPGTVMRPAHELVPAGEVVVILKRAGGTVRIETAYLNP